MGQTRPVNTARAGSDRATVEQRVNNLEGAALSAPDSLHFGPFFRILTVVDKRNPAK